MISIIIASADPDQLQQVTENIEITVGVPFEIIAINNSDGSKGICEIYNTGIRQAKYDMLCFMHEDVLIKTNNWGSTVLSFFATHSDYGLLGIGGSEYKSLAPSGWNPTGIETAYINLIQCFKYKQQEPFHYYKNPGEKEFAEVASVDGVWFCVPKAIAAKTMFDETTFKGFHAYDIDFSLNIGRTHKVGILFDVLIDHFSEGNYSAEWIVATLDLHKKWNSSLPVNLRPISKKQIFSAEKATFKFFIDQLILLKLPRNIAFEILYYNNSFFNLSPKLFFKLHFTILKKYSRRAKCRNQSL